MFKEKMTLLEDALKKKALPSITTFPSPYTKNAAGSGVIRIIFPEFTCVCPKTGYPDFASIDVYYLPAKTCIELKSWKLYLNSFRMIGSFHETVTAHLFTTLKGLLKPKWLLLGARERGVGGERAAADRSHDDRAARGAARAGARDGAVSAGA